MALAHEIMEAEKFWETSRGCCVTSSPRPKSPEPRATESQGPHELGALMPQAADPECPKGLWKAE